MILGIRHVAKCLSDEVCSYLCVFYLEVLKKMSSFICQFFFGKVIKQL